MFLPHQAATEDISADIAIIGAGPAGMALALALARQGINTVLISNGGHTLEASGPHTEGTIAFPEGHANPAALEAQRFGGLSWSWGGRCVAFSAIDLAARVELGLPGWPIGVDDIGKFSEDAAHFLGIGVPDFRGAGPAHGGMLTQLERWSAHPQLAAHHHETFADARGPRVYLGLTCVGGDIDGAGRVRALYLSKPDRTQVHVSASAFVLAGGGLETARLLLWLFASNGRTAPEWTGRGYMGHLTGQLLSVKDSPVLRTAFDYRRDSSCFVRPRLGFSDAALHKDALPSINFWLDNWPLADAGHGAPGLSLAYLALRSPWLGERLLPKALREYFLGKSAQKIDRHFANVLRDPVQAAAYCLAIWQARRRPPVRPGLLARSRHGTLPISFSAEETPRLQNGIKLLASRDPLGVPCASVSRDLQRDDIDRVIRANHHCAAALSQAGFKGIDFLGGSDEERGASVVHRSGDGYHQIGTARMGTAPSTAVTNPDGLVFGTENLFVSGSALFPRSGHANPTWTVVCLSLRLAGYLGRFRH